MNMTTEELFLGIQAVVAVSLTEKKREIDKEELKFKMT
jgi:hypothetical protein